MIVPVVEGIFAAYKCVETSPAWKELCLALPCFSDVRWPGYDTKVIEDVIDGEPVVIQLWKGTCQRFLGSNEFPGGIGAEVGVYHRVDKHDLPNDFTFLPEPMRLLMEGLELIDGSNLWWPFSELQTTIKLSLTNVARPEGFKLLMAGPEQTYWLNRWMVPPSYAQYVVDEGQVPTETTGYRLDYTINGRSGSW